MKILVIGSGAREHALAWKLSQSSLAKEIFIAPGNAGTALEKKLRNININTKDTLSLLNFAQYQNIDLTVVGPEEPLVNGIVNIFRNANLKILGPTKEAAQLEGSKIFAKEFLKRHKIPTAKYKKFININDAKNFLKTAKFPLVIKADCLAAGKGVFLAKTLLEAKTAVENILLKKIFNNNSCIIIEEYLKGREISFIVITDGNKVVPLETSKDYKLSGNYNTGINTGGMGAYSSSCIITKNLSKRIMEQIIFPTINGMKKEHNIYTGFLYAGLMIDELDQPKVIEFNCRCGDPETQPIMMRLKSDLLKVFLSVCNNDLNIKNLKWDTRPAISIVMATKNYPNIYNIGDQIHGLPIQNITNSKIFHSGTKFDKNKTILTNGGRVLSVTSLANDLLSAKNSAYEITKKIFWKGSFYRIDIGN